MRGAQDSRGISLAEALVAITVLALASTAAMMLYSGARRSFKVGSNLTEQQQNVRIAFDELTEDLRHVGFNVNPDGHGNRPDEQIELAAATAIVLRADHDATDPGASMVPEESLAGAGSVFFTVSTGNDEIVAYVLAKPPGSGGPPSNDAIAFEADMDGPVRDGLVEPIVIDGIALTHDDPPYTLYRVSWDAAGGEVREPLVDQISALAFSYFDERGQEVAPVPGEDDADRVHARARGSIRRIHVRVEGMTRDPDLRWRESSVEAGADGGHRRFDLAADVTPRNLGLFGVPDLDAVVRPPTRPPPPTLYEGHCGGLWVEWAPNPLTDAVALYELRWGTASDNVSLGPIYATTSEAYVGGLTTDTTYYVTVTAVDDAGASSQPSPPADRPVEDKNKPEAVTEPTASEGLDGYILVSWEPVTENQPPGDPIHDPISPEMRDAAGYHVYRSTDPAPLDPLETNPIPEALRVLSNYSSTSYEDWGIVKCRRYYYAMTAVDQCGWQGPPSPPVAGESVYFVNPQAPPGLQATQASIGAPVKLDWSSVTQDVNGTVIWIESYTIHRATGPYNHPNPATLDFATVHEITDASTSWDDENVATVPGQTYYYYVTAHDDCINESEPSDIASTGDCVFTGDTAIIQPVQNQELIYSMVWLEARVLNGVGTYSYEFRVVLLDGEQVVYEEASTSGLGAWDPAGHDPGHYRIDAIATQQVNGCTKQASIFVSLGL